MSRANAKLHRHLDLIAHLVGRRLPVTVEDIMEHVPAYAEKWETEDETARASVRRMFERDKEELRAAGIPIQTVRYSIGYGMEQLEGYRLERRDFYLPYLRLVRGGGGAPGAGGAAGASPGGGAGPAGGCGRPAASVQRSGELEVAESDAVLALEALRWVAELPAFPLAAEARTAFRKLAFDLEPAAFASVPVLYLEPPGAAGVGESVRTLTDALLARRRVRFRYHGIYRGETTTREVEPYGLLFQHSHWYLVANDPSRSGVRVFRVDRMERVEACDAPANGPAYEVPASFRLEDYARRAAWELGGEEGERLRAEVLFRFPASLLAERNRWGTPVRSGEDGSAVRAFDVAQPPPFLRWLLSLGGEAEVVGPPELAVEYRRMAAEVARRHATPAAVGGEAGGTEDSAPGTGEVRHG